MPIAEDAATENTPMPDADFLSFLKIRRRVDDCRAAPQSPPAISPPLPPFRRFRLLPAFSQLIFAASRHTLFSSMRYATEMFSLSLRRFHFITPELIIDAAISPVYNTQPAFSRYATPPFHAELSATPLHTRFAVCFLLMSREPRPPQALFSWLKTMLSAAIDAARLPPLRDTMKLRFRFRQITGAASPRDVITD
jgi:hypothetical protein